VEIRGVGIAGAQRHFGEGLFCGREELPRPPQAQAADDAAVAHALASQRKLQRRSLKVHVVSPSGRDRILAILGAGTIVGELSMFDGAPRSASVAAIRASKLSFVRRAVFDDVLHAQPEMYRELTIILARGLRDIDDAIAATSFLSVRGRTARALLALADAFGQDAGDGRIVIRQKVTQSDIAAMAGIVRENFSRVMHDWLDRSFFSRIAGYYCVENKLVLEHEGHF